jgi:hypothetical protein
VWATTCGAASSWRESGRAQAGLVTERWAVGLGKWAGARGVKNETTEQCDVSFPLSHTISHLKI